MVVELRNVERAFEARKILRGVSLEIAAGEMVAIVGASGCGKTTLLNVLGALDVEYTGEVKLLGQVLASLDDDARTTLRNKSIGFVFQAFHLLDHLSVAENVEVPLWLQPQRVSRAEEEARAKEALATVGLGERVKESVRPLSGGERQRVAIARAIVNRPTLLLADEPTGNLDKDTGRQIYELFERVKRGNCAVVVATHDRELAATADRVLTMKDGAL